MEADLERLLAVDLDWRARDDAEAERARAAGEPAAYHDLRVHERLPDIYWALERWDEARRWYRHNAAAMLEGRAWHEQHSGPDFPIDALSHHLAVMLVKAGRLADAGPALERAAAHWRTEPGNELVLAELALHAAQIGRAELSGDAHLAAVARRALSSDPERCDLLSYESAQVAVLLGRTDDARRDIEGREAAEHLPEILPPSLQDALLAALRGLRALLDGQPDAARDAFRTAAVGFFAFGDQLDSNVYFMVLNARMAADVAAGRAPDPNPFAGD